MWIEGPHGWRCAVVLEGGNSLIGLSRVSKPPNGSSTIRQKQHAATSILLETFRYSLESQIGTNLGRFWTGISEIRTAPMAERKWRDVFMFATDGTGTDRHIGWPEHDSLSKWVLQQTRTECVLFLKRFDCGWADVLLKIAIRYGKHYRRKQKK